MTESDGGEVPEPDWAVELTDTDLDIEGIPRGDGTRELTRDERLALFRDKYQIVTPERTEPAALKYPLPKRGRKKLIAVMAAGVLAVAGLVWGGVAFFSPDKFTMSYGIDVPKSSLSAAYQACTDATLERLKAPATAQFPELTKVEVPASADTSPGQDLYLLYFYVDSENGFGAMIRTDVTCVAKWGGTEFVLNPSTDISLK